MRVLALLAAGASSFFVCVAAALLFRWPANGHHLMVMNESGWHCGDVRQPVMV